MHKIRGLLAGLLGVVFLMSLLGLALSTATNKAIDNKNKVESWLDQSNLYGHFVSSAISEGSKSAGNAPQQGVVSLSDSAVSQAANQAFPYGFIKQNVNKVIESNYDWLEGKTATPNFTVDLSSAKQGFAQRVGDYVKMHLTGLPVCSLQQLAQLQTQTLDPLTIDCRPPNIDPQAAATKVTDQVDQSQDFLANSIITPNNINPNKPAQSMPYYQKLPKAPELYQLNRKLPLIFGVASGLSAIGAVFLARHRRVGFRRVGITLALAGVFLIAAELLSNNLFHKLEHRVFNNATDGQIQQSLTSFAHKIETSLLHTYLLFGIVYLLLAILVFALFITSRKRQSINQVSPDLQKQAAFTDPAHEPPGEINPELHLRPKAKKKPPRLIQ